MKNLKTIKDSSNNWNEYFTKREIRLINRICRKNFYEIHRRKIDWSKEKKEDLIKNTTNIYMKSDTCPNGLGINQLKTLHELLGTKNTIKVLKKVQDSSNVFFKTTEKGHYWKKTKDGSKVLNWNLIFNQFFIKPIKNKDNLYLDKLFFNLFEHIEINCIDNSFIYSVKRAGNPVLYLDFNYKYYSAKRYDNSIVSCSLKRFIEGKSISNKLYEFNNENYKELTVGWDMLDLDKYNESQSVKWNESQSVKWNVVQRLIQNNKQLLQMNPNKVNMDIILSTSSICENRNFLDLNSDEQALILDFYQKFGEYAFEIYRFIKVLSLNVNVNQVYEYTYLNIKINQKFLKTLNVINDNRTDFKDIFKIIKVANALQDKSISKYFDSIEAPFSDKIMDRIIFFGKIVSRISDKDIENLPLDIFIDFDKYDIPDKLFEKLINLYLETCDIKSLIPNISGETNNNYTYKVLGKRDHLSLIAKYTTMYCKSLDDKLCSDTYYIAESENAAVFAIFNKDGRIVSQSMLWFDETKSILVVDSIKSIIPTCPFRLEYETFVNHIMEVDKRIEVVNFGKYDYKDNLEYIMRMSHEKAKGPYAMEISRRYLDREKVSIETKSDIQECFC